MKKQTVTQPVTQQPAQQKQATLEQVLLQISMTFDNLKQLCTNVIIQQQKQIMELQEKLNTGGRDAKKTC